MKFSTAILIPLVSLMVSMSAIADQIAGYPKEFRKVAVSANDFIAVTRTVERTPRTRIRFKWKPNLAAIHADLYDFKVDHYKIEREARWLQRQFAQARAEADLVVQLWGHQMKPNGKCEAEERVELTFRSPQTTPNVNYPAEFNPLTFSSGKYVEIDVQDPALCKK